MTARNIARNFNVSATFNGKTYNSTSAEGIVSDIASDLGLDGYEPRLPLVNRTHTNTVTFFDRDAFWDGDDSASVTHELEFTATSYDICVTAVTLLDGETYIDRPFNEIKSMFFDLVIDLYQELGVGAGLVLDSDGCVEYTSLEKGISVFDIERGLFRVDDYYGLHIWVKHTAENAHLVERLQEAVYDSELASEIQFDDDEELSSAC